MVTTQIAALGIDGDPARATVQLGAADRDIVAGPLHLALVLDLHGVGELAVGAPEEASVRGVLFDLVLGREHEIDLAGPVEGHDDLVGAAIHELILEIGGLAEFPESLALRVDDFDQLRQGGGLLLLPVYHEAHAGRAGHELPGLAHENGTRALLEPLDRLVVVAVRRQNLDALVVRVGDIKEAFVIKGQPDGVIELAGPLAFAPKGRQVFPLGAELLDAVVAGVENEEIAGAVDGDGRRHVEGHILVGRFDVAERADGLERHFRGFAPGSWAGIVDELDAVHGLDLLAGESKHRGQNDRGDDQDGLCSHARFSLSC